LQKIDTRRICPPMKIGGHLIIMNSMSFQEYSDICKTGKVLRSELSDYKGNYYRIKTVKNSGKIYTFLFVNGELAMSYTEENK
jgi:hypothetical protein